MDNKYYNIANMEDSGFLRIFTRQTKQEETRDTLTPVDSTGTRAPLQDDILSPNHAFSENEDGTRTLTLFSHFPRGRKEKGFYRGSLNIDNIPELADSAFAASVTTLVIRGEAIAARDIKCIKKYRASNGGVLPGLTRVSLPDFAGEIPNLGHEYEPNAWLERFEAPMAKSVGYIAFNNCTGLVSVDLSAAEIIEERAFARCSRLTTVDLPVARIVHCRAFERCSRLITVNLPAAKVVCLWAFKDCSSLTTVDLPVARIIQSRAFERCSNLTTVDLPAARIIQSRAFERCSNLKTINLPVAEIIERRAFKYCSSLITVDLPAAKKIKRYALYDCSRLITVNLPVAKSIGRRAFKYCSSLATVDLPAAKTIESRAFEYCPNLTTVDLPAAKKIRNEVFFCCSALRTLKLGYAGKVRLKADIFGNKDRDMANIIDLYLDAARVPSKGRRRYGKYTWRHIQTYIP
jgi:hypothetical protein